MLSVHGRLLLRPVAAFALLLAGVPLRRGFRSSVERAAGQWNEALGQILAKGPDELRAELAGHLVAGPDDGADGTERTG
ncbi:hypothetical protein ACFC5Z_22570 [Streptomyces sp. NPDC056004]|uniref:hypothetical protein n=1 Tax=unclassified Streptomyces TaxID=2593676 RepID=UPI0035DC0B2C